ncbi:MAG: tetratricopeptide repeat protein, partial [Thermomicrobiales bacterium]
SFFIEEVLTSLIAAGDIFYRNGDWDRKPLGEFSIPRSVQDAVLQRAERLTEAARGLLRLAAVIGRRFDFSLLQTLTQLDERQLIELLKELIAGGLLIEDTNDRFACRHALTRQTIYAGLLARERRTMHQAIADALERHVVAPDSYLTDLAHHFYQAGGWEQTLAYAQRAGERAMTLYAPRAAIEQLSHALEAARQLRIPAPAAVVRRRAQAYEWIGEFQAAERDYAAALEQARAADDQETEWQTLHDLGMLWTGREFEHSRDYYQQALDLARAIDQPAMLGHSLNRLGNWHANADQPKEGQRFHDEALSIFQLRGDERGVAATLDLLGITAIMDSDLARAVDCYRQAVKRWEALDQRRELASSLGALAVCGGILHGNTVMAAIPSTEAVREAERGWALAAEIGWRGGESFVQTILGSHLGMRGEYGRALTLVQSAHSIASEIDHRAWIAQAQHVLGGLYLDLLALPEAIEQLEDAFAVARELGSLYRLRSVAGLLASAWIADNQLARAERALDDVLDQDAPFETLGQRPCWHARAELALAREEPDLALTIADRLMATTRNTAGDGQSAVPRLALLRGNALAGLGRPADAERAFRAAIDCSGSQGTRPVLWRAHLALGQLCLGQRRSDDAEPELRAAQAIIQSLADSIDVAAVRDAFLLRAASLLPRPYSGLLHRPAEPTTSALSAREQEVATLIAQGKTNGEIADALFVSKRTIETHVGSILSKLGYTTRAQIIAWVLAAGSVNSSTDGTA